MADLTHNDLCVIPQAVINEWNSDRNSRNIPNLKKNPLVSKGEVVAPQPGQELFAHNFISIADFALLANLALRTTTSPRRRYIHSAPKNLLYFDEARILLTDPSLYGNIWGNYDDSIYNPRLFRYVPGDFSIGPTTVNYDYFPELFWETLINEAEVLPEPTTTTIPSPQDTNLDSNIFQTPFYNVRNDFGNLKAGCVLMVQSLPTLDGTSVSVTGKTSDGSPLQPYGYTAAASVNGRYERWSRSSSEGQTLSENHTTYVPTSYSYETVLANGNYFQHDNSQTKITGGSVSISFIVTYAFKAARNYGGAWDTPKGITIRYHNIDSLGTLSEDSSTGATYFTPNSSAMTSELNSISDSTTVSFPNTQNENFDRELYTQVGFAIFSRINPSFYS